MPSAREDCVDTTMPSEANADLVDNEMLSIREDILSETNMSLDVDNSESASEAVVPNCMSSTQTDLTGVDDDKSRQTEGPVDPSAKLGSDKVF